MTKIENPTSKISIKIQHDNKEAVNKKKIGFISAIFIVIGSSIGSGIFFKANSILSSVGFSFPLAIASWVISAIAVIAMSLSLIEITSGKNDNLSLIGWNKTFNNKFIYKMCKNFMFYLYLPLTFFFLPFYAILAFQDALTGFGIANNFNTQNDWAIWMVICIVIFLWFVVSSGLSSRIGNIQNWIITSVKFFPLVIIIILGFVIASMNGTKIEISPNVSENSNQSFITMSAGIGMFMSFSAVFFAYDGFYYSAGLQSEMKEPQKTSSALVIGLIIVTVIYLVIAISMSIATDGGDFKGFHQFLIDKNVGWIFGVVNLMICIGVLGIVNSFAMWSTRFTEDLLKLGELPLYYKFINKLNSNRPIIGLIYVLIISFPVVILFSIIGGLGYVSSDSYLNSVNVAYIDNTNQTIYSSIKLSIYDKAFDFSNWKTITDANDINYYLANDYNSYNQLLIHASNYNSMANLLTFSDLMANWTAILAFAFIVFAIVGCCINRKTNKVKVNKSKIFIPSAIIAITIVSIGLIVQAIAPFVDLFLLLNFETIPENVLIGRIMTIVVLFVYLFFMIFPSLFDHDSKFFKNKKDKMINL